VVYPADHAIDTAMRSLACAKLPKTVVCSTENPLPPYDDPEMETELSYAVRSVIKMHRGELEGS
jgi:hypothetical protein